MAITAVPLSPVQRPSLAHGNADLTRKGAPDILRQGLSYPVWLLAHKPYCQGYTRRLVTTYGRNF